MKYCSLLLLSVLLAAGLALTPALLIPEIPVWILDVGIRTTVAATLYLLLLLWLRPSPDFDVFMKTLLRKARLVK